MKRMSAKYAQAWQNPGPTRNCRYSLTHQVRLECLTAVVDSTWDTNAQLEGSTMLNIFAERGKSSLCFVSVWNLKKKKKFLQNICCMFLCPSMAYKWVCSDGLIMLPLEVNIKSWFASFVGLSKTNIWVISIFKSFHTEMSCMLSALLFIPPCPKNKVSLTFGEFYQL